MGGRLSTKRFAGDIATLRRWQVPSGSCHHVHVDGLSPRFLTPADVAEVLAVSPSQVLKYLRDRELRGIKLPGKGEWRVEANALEDFIRARYAATQGDSADAERSDDIPRR
ncbi:MAG: DNA-binding protein [Actinobacteria bacterium]|nr:DNA-binding protein [Actinomycetota bacterium]